MRSPYLRAYKPKTRRIPLHAKREESVQMQVCNYLRRNYPGIIFRSDFASGLALTPAQAVRHRQLQSSRSWPDLQVVEPWRGYHSLFIEIKKPGTAIYVTRGPRKGQLVSDQHIEEQALMLQALNAKGFFARFGVGLDACKRLVDWYMNENYQEQENGELF